MKRNNKKGFTIVELVIVIAAIAILTAVLIPTFSGVIKKANASSARQKARAEYERFVAEYAEEIGNDAVFYIEVKDAEAWFKVEKGEFTDIDNPGSAADTDDDLTAHKAIKTYTKTSGSTDPTGVTFYNSDEASFGTLTGATTAAENLVEGTTYYYAGTEDAIADQNDNIAIYAAK